MKRNFDWSLIHRVATGQLPSKGELGPLFELGDEFRRRCRRLDRWRKRNNCQLTGVTKKAQYHTRYALGTFCDCLAQLAALGSHGLTPDEQRVCLEQMVNMAAMLIVHRSAVDGGGLTRRYCDERVAARN